MDAMYARARDRRYTSPAAPRARCVRKYSTLRQAPGHREGPELEKIITHSPFTHSPIHPFTHSPIHSLIPYPLRRIRSFTYSPHSTSTSTSAQQPRKYVYVHVHTAYIVAHTFIHSTYFISASFPSRQIAHASELEADRKTRDARRETQDARREPRKGATYDHAVTSRAARSPPGRARASDLVVTRNVCTGAS